VDRGGEEKISVLGVMGKKKKKEVLGVLSLSGKRQRKNSQGHLRKEGEGSGTQVMREKGN